MELLEYDQEWERKWDEFVLDKAFNGTFLQTRRFINYHPEDRFVDRSIIFTDKGKICAVCPACEQMVLGEKVFSSHGGMTFGGLVLMQDYYRTEKIFQILDLFDEYLRVQQYRKVSLKITPAIFSRRSMALLEYSLRYYGYEERIELNTYVDLTKSTDDIWNDIDRNKKRALRKAQEAQMIFRKLETDEEVAIFYSLLVKNLEKHGIKPIHSLIEILDFKNQRLKSETKFYGVFKEEKMLAGGMLFSFFNTNVLHAQNLSADTDYMESGAIAFLYYSVIFEAKRLGYDKLSWGISTEQQGQIINKGLIRNKESYGSEYYLNHTYIKQIENAL